MAQTGFPKGVFYDTQRFNPRWSSWVCFCEVIIGKKYLRRPNIRKWFDILVEKKDYSKSDKRELLGYLYGLAKE